MLGSLAEDFLEDGKELAAAFHPGLEAFEAFVVEFALFRVCGQGGGFAKFLEFGFSAVEVGTDLFADETTDEAFQIGSGFVVGAAVAVAGEPGDRSPAAASP